MTSTILYSVRAYSQYMTWTHFPSLEVCIALSMKLIIIWN